MDNISGKIYHFDRDFGLSTPRFGNLLLYQVGELYCEEGFTNGSHRQWCYELTYIESGVCTIVSNGRTCMARAGDVVVSGRDCTHAIVADQESRVRFLYLGFDVVPEACRENPHMADILRYFDSTKTPCTSDRFGVGDLMHKLLQEFYCEYSGFEDVIASYMNLIVLLAYRSGHPDSRTSTLTDSTEESIGATVYRIVRYVDDHLYAIDSIRSIANALNYNYSYLSYMFKKHTGITLQKYIANKKMEHAQVLLTERGESIAKVSAQLGYKNTASFSKAFNNVYNMSPSAFIKQYKKEDPTT